MRASLLSNASKVWAVRNSEIPQFRKGIKKINQKLGKLPKKVKFISLLRPFQLRKKNTICNLKNLK